SWPRIVLFFFPRPAGGPGLCETRPSPPGGCGIGAVGSCWAGGALNIADDASRCVGALIDADAPSGSFGAGTAGSGAGCTCGGTGDIMIALDPSAGRGAAASFVKSCTCTGTGPNARTAPASMGVGVPAAIFVVPT